MGSKWEVLAGVDKTNMTTETLEGPGGWLYRVSSLDENGVGIAAGLAVCFVPNPKKRKEEKDGNV